MGQEAGHCQTRSKFQNRALQNKLRIWNFILNSTEGITKVSNVTGLLLQENILVPGCQWVIATAGKLQVA